MNDLKDLYSCRIRISIALFCYETQLQFHPFVWMFKARKSSFLGIVQVTITFGPITIGLTKQISTPDLSGIDYEVTDL